MDRELENIDSGEERRPSYLGVMLGQALRNARKERGLSQKEVASLSGIPQANLSRIEKGKANPGIREIERYLEAIGADMSIEVR